MTSTKEVLPKTAGSLGVSDALWIKLFSGKKTTLKSTRPTGQSI